MMLDFLIFFQYALLLAYGIILSAAFAGIEPTRHNIAIGFALFAGCGLMQLAALLAFGESFTRCAYPFITHLPVILLLCLRYRKRLIPSFACVATAYMCCQPANWLGEVTASLSGNEFVEQVVRSMALVILGILMLRFAAKSLSAIFEKDDREILVFSIVPFVYYIFDYSMAVYSDKWYEYSAPVAEFLPFVFCTAFLVFCVVYHQAYEKKLESERRAKIVSMAVDQQRREMEAMKRGENRISILRHDMRFMLGNLLQYLNEGDVAAAQKLLKEHLEEIEETNVKRFCENDLINYTLSSCYARCEKEGVRFSPEARIPKIEIDELLLASLLSNALDNALNAMENLPEGQRFIELSLRVINNRLLLRIANPVSVAPRFVDGIPVTNRPGHGYGIQSIRYATENLGGNGRFTMEDNLFVLEVIISL